jgi:hypothetical protein
MPKAIHGLIDGLAERDRDFYLALQGEDDLGMVVRAHIHIEHEVREFILAAAPKPKHVDFSTMTYASAVRLALVLGLDDSFQPALTKLGSLRNKFSHRLNMKLGDEEATGLYAALSETAKLAAEHSYSKLRADSSDGERPEHFGALPSRDRVILCVVSLRGGILVELARAAGKLDDLIALADSGRP